MNDIYRERITRKLQVELGSDVVDALNNPNVIEIMLNSDGRLWIEKFGQDIQFAGEISASQAHSLMSTVATALGTSITSDSPILEGELPIDGSRFEGLIPPVVAKPVFTIRKKASKVFTLAHYIEQGVITENHSKIICDAVRNRQNILVVGGTGSGKTTLTNAIIDQIVKITPEHRLVIIEDTAEIQCLADNAVILRSTDSVDMQRLLKATMRLRPDRILVGEVRGGEALTLLKSWNTGHPGGIATVHANSAHAGLVRIEQLVGEVSSTPMKPLIAEAVNLVISIEKFKERRRIKQIIQVTGYDPKLQTYQIQELEE